MDGVERLRSSVAWGVFGQASLSAYGVTPVGGKSGVVVGAISARRNEHTSGTEARLTRNAGGQVWSRLRVCNGIEPAVLNKNGKGKT